MNHIPTDYLETSHRKQHETKASIELIHVFLMLFDLLTDT